MSRNYLISLEEKNKKGCHYVVPFSVLGLSNDIKTLEEIDNFSKNKLEHDLINKVISSNIYPNLDLNNLYLTIIYKDKKIRNLPFIDKTNKDILDIDLEKVFKNFDREKSSLFYNSFKSYLNKNHISKNFKTFILSVKENNDILLNLNKLSYEEKRELKIYISKNI